MRQAYDYWQDQPGSYPHGDVPDAKPLSQAKPRVRSSHKPLAVADEAGLSNHFRTFCAFCTQPKGTNGEGHKTASPSTLSKQNFYATSFYLPSAIPKACCSNAYQSAGCRNARQRRNARLPSNDAKHISHQRPSPTTSHHLLRRLRKHRSIPISNLAARPKNLTNCFSSTPGRLQMTREPYV